MVRLSLERQMGNKRSQWSDDATEKSYAAKEAFSGRRIEDVIEGENANGKQRGRQARHFVSKGIWQ